jgi:hypothetical protein
MKLFITFGILFLVPYILRFLLKKDVSRQCFALVTSFILASIILIMSILFVKEVRFVIRSAIFMLFLVGSYPTSYFLYPLFKSTQHQ